MDPTPSAQRLRCGLPGYLILFAPHTFAPQRQDMPREPPSPPVFLLISAHFTATPGNPFSPAYLQSARIESKPPVKPVDFTPDATNRLRALYAQSFRTTLAPYVLPRLLARSWPVLLLHIPSPTPHVESASSVLKEVYNPKAVIPHAALLDQASAHCPIFPTAASRRSLGRVSVPVWPVTLSGRLPVKALVGHYPTNKLIGREHIPHRKKPFHHTPCRTQSHPVLATLAGSYPRVEGRLLTCYSPVRRSSTPRRRPFRSTCMC